MHTFLKSFKKVMLLNTNENRTAENRTLDSIDNYKTTLGAMCALAYVLEKHYGAESRIAPVMDPSPRNRIQATDPVTPDMVSEGNDVDLVVEVKRSLPNNKSGQIDALNQIRKYDDDLTGWKRNTRRHDIMLMVHTSKSAQWAVFLGRMQGEKKTSFNRKVTIVEYMRSSERETYFQLKRVWGKTSNAVLNRHLYNGIVVKSDQIIKMISVAKFCDSKPDIAYTMSILWNHIFSSLITKDKHWSAKGRKAVDHMFDLKEIMEKLRDAEGSFSYPPKQAWISEALNAFVLLEMAERHPGDRFLVHYKSVRGDLVEYFVKKLAKSTARKKQGHKKQDQVGDIRDYF